MNTWIIKLTICAALLAACSQNSNELNPTAAIEKPTDVPPTVAFTPTPSPTQEEQATPTTEQEPTPTTGIDQEALKDKWRIAYSGSEILFTTCDYMLRTIHRLQEGEIDITRARSELSFENGVISLVLTRNLRWGQTSEAVLPFKESLWAALENLIQVMEQLDQMSDEDLAASGPLLIDTIFDACTPFFEDRQSIALTAMGAGMTEESLSELFIEFEEIITDLIAFMNE